MVTVMIHRPLGSQEVISGAGSAAGSRLRAVQLARDDIFGYSSNFCKEFACTVVLRRF
jgi:hypothetical protein